MRYMMIALLLLSLTLTSTPSTARQTTDFMTRYTELSNVNIGNGAPKQINFLEWLRYVKEFSHKRNINPNRALAVLETESSKHGKCLTFGPINHSGRNIGPGGIFKYCKEDKDWQRRLLDPYFNTEVAILAMTRFTDFNKSMHKYNTLCNSAYLGRIRELERKNKESQIFENLDLCQLIYKYDLK